MPRHSVENSYPLFGIFGYPLDETASPAMYTAAFRRHKRPSIYLPFKLEPRAKRHLVTLMRLMDMQGANVTAPYKEAAYRQVDRLDKSAKVAGSVNTIVYRQSKMIGYNTDGAGFMAALRDHRLSLTKKNILIIGAGGAARAIVAALAKEKWQSLTILNRHIAKAAAIAAIIPRRSIHVGKLSPASWKTKTANADIIIHATSAPLKTFTLTDIQTKTTVVDLHYGKKALPKRSQRPFRYIDGSRMLAHQAALSFTLFTGLTVPRPLLTRAITRYLNGV